jgi:acetyltransferase-like isoleucine patch superfamily enzyme
MKKIENEVYRWLEMLLSLIPGFIGFNLRRVLYTRSLKSCGNVFRIGVFSRIQQPQAITIGDHVSFNDGAWIAANDNGGEISIGDNTIVGPRVILHSGNHIYKDKTVPVWKQGYHFKPIVIKDDVWLGSNVTVLQGVTINKGAIVAAGSIVTKDIDEFAIVAGVPAKKIGER